MTKIEASAIKSPSACYSSPGLGMARSTLSIPELKLEPSTSLKSKPAKPVAEYRGRLRNHQPVKHKVSIEDLQDSLAKFELKRTTSLEQSTASVYQATELKKSGTQDGERSASPKHRSIESKIDGFLMQLKSTNPDDIKMNSEIFGDLLVSFAATFKTDVDKLVDVILDNPADSINMASLRTRLTDLVAKK